MTCRTARHGDSSPSRSIPNSLLTGAILVALWLVGCADAPSRHTVDVTLAADSIPALRLPTARDSARLAAAEEIRTVGDLNAQLMFKGVSSLATEGDRLWVTARWMSPHVTVIDLRRGGLLARLVNEGTNDDEAVDPTCVQPGIGPLGTVSIVDRGRQRLLNLRGNAAAGWRIASIAKFKTDVAVECAVTLRDRLLGFGNFADHTSVEMSLTGVGEVRHSATPPFNAAAMQVQAARRELNASVVAVAPSRDRFVLAYKKIARLDFLDDHGRAAITVVGPRPVKQHYWWDSLRTRHRMSGVNPQAGGELAFGKDAELAYVAVAAGNSRIYALFCGCAWRKPEPRRIHVYTWKGDFVAEWIVDVPLTGLAVTPNDSLMIASYRAADSTGAWRERLGLWVLPRTEGPDGKRSNQLVVR